MSLGCERYINKVIIIMSARNLRFDLEINTRVWRLVYITFFFQKSVKRFSELTDSQTIYHHEGGQHETSFPGLPESPLSFR